MAIISISGKMGSGKDTVGNIIQYLTSDNYKKYNKPYELNNITYEYYGSDWQIKKFADKLKDIVCILLNCNKKDLESREFKDNELGEEWNRLIPIEDSFKPEFRVQKMTPRLLLQLLGTDCCRDIIHPNIWVNTLMSEYTQDTGYTYEVQVLDKLSDKEYNLKLLSDPVSYTGNYPNWIITDCRFKNELLSVKERKGITIKVERFNTEENNHISENELNFEEFDYVINNNNSIEELIESVKQILIKEKIIN